LSVNFELKFREHLDLKTMKLTFCNVFLMVAMVELGEAQFFGLDSIGATQNCLNSNCNQNNFGRKRRQVLEEILAEVEEEELARSRNVAKVKREIVDILNSLTKEALDVENRNAMIQKEANIQNKREAEADPQTFNCMGSNCNLNNLGTINNNGPKEDKATIQKHEKRDAEADPQTFNCLGSNCNANNFGTINNGRKENEATVQKHKKREAEADPQTFNCVGSNCGLNNFGTINNAGREGEEITVQRNTEIHEHEKREAEANADPQTFNCVGANCNLNNAGVINNFGRGKREADADPQTFNCVGSNCGLNNLGTINNAGRGKREADADPQNFNCVGSNCNLNNVGNINNFNRRKREIADMIDSLTRDMLDAEE